MNITDVGFAGVRMIQLDPARDERGSFVRFFCRRTFQDAGLNIEWPQTNFSHTFQRGALRGLHFQSEPAAETKLITCLSGVVYDVLVDISPSSSTFGQWRAYELSEESGVALYVPTGIAHGFQCLTNDCRMAYMMSCSYEPALARGVCYNDPGLAIHWPLPVACVSLKDATLPLLQAAE